LAGLRLAALLNHTLGKTSASKISAVSQFPTRGR
jgi:hypothetical protein